MSRPTFWEGVGVALAAGISGAIGFFALTWAFSPVFSLRFVIGGFAFLYCLYLLGRCKRKSGRVVAMTVWVILAATVWLLNPPLTLFVLFHVLAIWLIRALYCYRRLLTGVVDLGLCCFAIAAASWALLQTESVGLALWCFFLVLAIFVEFDPNDVSGPASELPVTHRDRDFNRAYRAAEAAVRKLSN